MTLYPDYKLFSPTYIWFEKYMIPRGISQKSICEETGIPTSTFTQLLKGKMSLTVEKALILADFSNIDVKILLHLNHIYKCVKNLINGYPEWSARQKLIYEILHVA
jgi:plasmid maintenance system antidote protein VapI